MVQRADKRPCRGVTNPRKVPAGGGAVNDIGQTAPVAHWPDRISRAERVRGEFCRGMVRIPTKRRLFPVYQRRPADITIAGTATKS